MDYAVLDYLLFVFLIMHIRLLCFSRPILLQLLFGSIGLDLLKGILEITVFDGLSLFGYRFRGIPVPMIKVGDGV